MHPYPVQGHGGRGFEHIAGCQFMAGVANLESPVILTGMWEEVQESIWSQDFVAVRQQREAQPFLKQFIC